MLIEEASEDRDMTRAASCRQSRKGASRAYEGNASKFNGRPRRLCDERRDKAIWEWRKGLDGFAAPGMTADFGSAYPA
jgi:hypothetical protein